MKVHVFPCGPFMTNAYLVLCPRSRSAAVIDPAPGSKEHIEAVLESEKATLCSIWLTHSHWDHIADCARIQNREEGKEIPLYVHMLDKDNLIHPGSDGLPLMMPIIPCRPTHLLREGDELSLGDLSFRVLHTPGHSPGSICLFNEKERVLFTGDTLFRGTYGNTSFPSSCPEAMRASLKRLSSMEGDDIIIYPGHGSESTLYREREWIIPTMSA